MADGVDKFIILVLILQIAFAIANVTGIFPVAQSVPGFDYDKIVELKDEISQEAENLDSVLDYMIVIRKLLYLGVKIVISFIVAVFSTIPFILKLFMMPEDLANLLGYGADVLILLGLGNIMLQRSGY